MAKKARDTKLPLYRTSVTLEEGHRYALDFVAPGNASEALRYLIRYAIQHGALEPFRPKPAQPLLTTGGRPCTLDDLAGLDD